MLDTLSEFFLALAQQPLDPRKRIYLGYLIAAAVIAVLWRFKLGSSANYSLRSLFNAKVWWGRSARADYLVILINQAIMLLLSPLLLAKLSVAASVYYALSQAAGAPGLFANAPPLLATVSYSLTLFLMDDWSRFALHKLMHDSPLLWAFHKVHHSARTMTPLTVYRVHPVETVLFTLRSALVQGICTAVFIYFMGNKLSLLSIFGVSAFIFIFNTVGSNLRHSHIRLCYWPCLEKIFISPFQHQLHHSTAPQHFNKNYGAVLAVWDLWRGSLIGSANQAPPRFGLRRREQDQEHSLRSLYWHPLAEACMRIQKLVSR